MPDLEWASLFLSIIKNPSNTGKLRKSVFDEDLNKFFKKIQISFLQVFYVKIIL